MHTCSACALLSVRKLPSPGMVGPRLVDGVLHVVRHKRRRLTVRPVDVDPDAAEREQGQGGGGSGGGRAHAACGGPSRDNSRLDY